MKCEIKEELQKIKIPKELHQRVELGVKQAKKKKIKNRKWISSLVASILILGASWTVSGSYLVDAANTLFNKILGPEEKLDEKFSSKENYVQWKDHLELAEKHLSSKDYADYSELVKEQFEIVRNMRLENRKSLTSKEEEKSNEISEKLAKYEEKLSQLTTHTFEEAQAMDSYPVNRPTYVPDGYKLQNEEVHTTDRNVEKEPTITLYYSEEEFGFTTEQQPIEQKDQIEITNDNWESDHTESYTLKGYQFDYTFYDDSNVKGMRITLPDKGYKIIIQADILPKEEMEKVLLSMLNSN